MTRWAGNRACPQIPDATGAIRNGQPAAATPASQPAAAANTMTVTIIDGKTGAKEEVTVPSRSAAATAAGSMEPGLYQKSLESTAYLWSHSKNCRRWHATGRRIRPAGAPLAGKPDAPRIAIIVGGMGANRAITADALGRLPAAVTLGFVPIGNDVATLARAGGHELLLQVPMETADDGDRNSDPQTLLTSLAPEQNIDRLYRAMARACKAMSANAPGARFTAIEGSLAPILSETAKRGLVDVDDGSNPASVARRLAAADNVPFARAEVLIDSAAAPGDMFPSSPDQRRRERQAERLRRRAADDTGQINWDHRPFRLPACHPSLAMRFEALPYRPCVGVMLLNRDGLAFIGRRIEGPEYVDPRHAWQMPQGGIDKGEDPWSAALRELREETNIRSVKRLGEIAQWLQYDIPRELIGKAWKGKYRGQTQKWFALRFTGADTEIDVEHPDGASQAEFVAWRWEPAHNIPNLIVPFKRAVYERVVAEFAKFAAAPK